jgi:hypothetical protein
MGGAAANLSESSTLPDPAFFQLPRFVPARLILFFSARFGFLL